MTETARAEHEEGGRAHGEGGAARSQVLMLGDETAWISVPEAWTVVESGLTHHEIGFETCPDATLSIRLHGLEDPAAVAADDVSRYLIEPGHPAPPGVPTVPGCLFVTIGLPGDQRRHGDLRHAADGVRPRRPSRPGEHGTYQRFYRQADVLPPSHVRVLAATLAVPFGRRKDAVVAALEAQVLEAMRGARFASGRTGLDRIAPSDAWKRVSFWEVIHMRIPVDWWWSREHDDGTGMYVASDPAEAEGPTLWVDFDQFEALESAADSAAAYKGHVDELVAQLAQAGDAGRALACERLGPFDTALTYAFVDTRQEQHWHYDYCHRVVLKGRHLVVAHFSVIRPDRPGAGETTAARLKREIRNAWIVPG
jgi:hypothetical protein